MAKCVIKACGNLATRVCGNLNLCAGLPAGIKGAIHAVEEVWNDAEPSMPMAQPATTAAQLLPAADPTQPLSQIFGETTELLAPEPQKVQQDMDSILTEEEPRRYNTSGAPGGFNELGRKTML